jgi:hypothetical protein
MTTSPSTTVLLVAGFFLAMGSIALARPERVVGYFGIDSLTREGRNEVRAVYGGFGVAISGLLAATLWLPSVRRGVLLTVAVALAGMVAGRLVSTAIDGAPRFYPWLFCGVEVLLAAALLSALRAAG